MPPGTEQVPAAAPAARRHRDEDTTMGEKHIARFEPVGIEIEVDEDETILDAAFRQGIMLMHGCKEGQCSSCKSFLLDGEVDLDRYSTFALPDFEEAEGYTLLCRAHALTDVEIELLHYDEEAHPQRGADRHGDDRGRGRRGAHPRHPPARAASVREPEALEFNAGQYVDIGIPGADGEHRSFSMANTPGEPDRLEFMIKLYEGGHFSGLLANGNGISVGDELTCKGPYGMFTLRDSSPRRLVFIAGGAGMAPILSLLRSMAEKGTERPATFYYGARTAGRPLRARGDRAARRASCPTSRSSRRSRRPTRTATGTARPG